jgi:hypothetical protein
MLFVAGLPWNLEVVHSFETLGLSSPAAQCDIPEYENPQLWMPLVIKFNQAERRADNF